MAKQDYQDADEWEELSPDLKVLRGKDGRIKSTQMSAERAGEIGAMKGRKYERQQEDDQLITDILVALGKDPEDAHWRMMAKRYAEGKTGAVAAGVFLAKSAGRGPQEEGHQVELSQVGSIQYARVDGVDYMRWPDMTRDQALSLLYVIQALPTHLTEDERQHINEQRWQWAWDRSPNNPSAYASAAEATKNHD